MIESRVWIAQVLCPARHAILATSGVASNQSDAEESLLTPLVALIHQLIADDTINPWCDICSAPSDRWTHEVGRTRWRTMDEAQPHLEAAQEANLAANAAFGRSGKTGN